MHCIQFKADTSKLSKEVKALNILTKIDKGIAKVEEIIIVAFTVIPLVSLIIQVVCRYLLYIPTPWAEELARYLFMVACFTGLSFGVYNGSHITINVVDIPIKKRAKNPSRTLNNLDIFSYVLIFIFSVGFIWIFKDYYIFSLSMMQITPVMAIPLPFFMTFLLIGFACCTYHSVIKIMECVKINRKM